MFVERPDVKLYWEAAGDRAPDIFLCPPRQPVAYGRLWKNQMPYLSHHFRVVTMDPRGNGRSDRPATGYDFETHYADLRAVLEAAVRPPFVFVAYSCASMLAVRYAIEHPDRVSHLVFVAAQYRQALPQPFESKVARVIRDDFDGWRHRLFTKCLPEPHSLKSVEDMMQWAGESSPEIYVEALRSLEADDVFELLGKIRTPTLVVHGTEDPVVPYRHGERFAQAVPGARMVTFEGGGHSLPGREPVKVNHAIRDFVLGAPPQVERVPRMAERTVAPRRRRSSARRVLWLSSPIGLGHIQRDIAMARRLRELHPDVTIDFLAADPARRVVEVSCERLHPATDRLLNESAHFEAWSKDHELHAFDALWEMDEIMANNFLVFADVAEAGGYDLWVGDEGWDLDYYLHENPDIKRAPYAFVTDFIGMLPMRDDPASTEFRRVWEKNAENIDHLRLHPDVRDLSLMVGDEEDVLDRPFGPDLPNMRHWAREHFKFSCYTYHFDPRDYADRTRLRQELGYRDGERLILVSVGGTRAGKNLLRKCAEAFALAAPKLPDARMVLVTGPRLDPQDFPKVPGLDVRPFVPHLFRHHAAADLAIVQGGLTTTMELAAFRTPFLYFPLRNHFEQRFFVSRRLDRLGAGVRLEYDQTTPEELAGRIVEQLGAPARWADVPRDGTDRAARMLADLLD